MIKKIYYKGYYGFFGFVPRYKYTLYLLLGIIPIYLKKQEL